MRLSAFKSASHKKSIFLKTRRFFSFKFFQGYNWLTNYPDSEFHGHWKTVTLSFISPNLSKHWRFLPFWLSLCFWEFSIVSSLSWYSILVQHACNDRAWLTSECSPRYDNFGTVRQGIEKCYIISSPWTSPRSTRIKKIEVQVAFLYCSIPEQCLNRAESNRYLSNAKARL